MADLEIRQVQNGCVIPVRVVPGSSRTCIVGVLNGMLKVKVAAPPEKGRANRCLIKCIAGVLKISQNTLSIVSGQTSSVKQLRVDGVCAEDLKNKLIAKL